MVGQRAIQLQDFLIDYGGRIESCNPQGHVPSRLIEFVAIIEAHELEGIIIKGQRVIEQGSGIGSAAFSFNYKGYNVVGYELDRSLVERANELREELLKRGLLNPDLACEFRHGSYFPADYLRVMRQQRANGIPTSEDLGALSNPECFDYLHVVPGPVTLKELKTYDIFYVYPWIVQKMPSLVELFSLCARNDAILLFKLADGWPLKMDRVLKLHKLRKVGTSAFVKSN